MDDIRQMVEKARAAQKAFAATATQEQVDAICKAIAKVVFTRAEELARMAIDETRMGVYEDKVKKCQGKSRTIWNSLRDKKSVGVIRKDEEKNILEVAKPLGIICAVTPTTNPVVTPMCNAMFAIKSCNAIIVAPHPRAKKCADYVVELFRAELARLGAPEDLIQTIKEPSIDLTTELMSQVDVVVATGGMGVVKSAYSSGKPSLGVGAGNVQCILDRGIDLDKAVSDVIAGRTFDNGIICSGEQTVICPSEMEDDVVATFKEKGGYVVLEADEKKALEDVLFPDGVISKDLVGQGIDEIADASGISVPDGTKVFLIKESNDNADSVLRKEKMFPVLTLFTYEDIDQAIAIAKQNLEIEGMGHSVCVHSFDDDNITKIGLALNVSRVVTNAPCSTTAGGSFFNGFAPTTTLGCGSWGNNSISENLDYKHLMNITRIGFIRKDIVPPTDDELWAD